MEERGKYGVSDIYKGGYSSLAPEDSSYTGFRVPAGQLGLHTTPGVVNQLEQVNLFLNQGAVPIELMTILGTKDFDAIPKQHFKEIGRLADLAGAKISVHAPVIEPSGWSQQGWEEASRVEMERQLNDVIDKAVEVDKNGGVPITIHASNMPGSHLFIDPKTGEKKQMLVAINQEDPSKLVPIKEEERFYPTNEIEGGQIKPYMPNIKDEINTYNHTHWDNQISQLIFYKEKADEILKDNEMSILEFLPKLANQEEIDASQMTPGQKNAYAHILNANTYLRETGQHLNGIFNKAYKFCSEDDKKKLLKFAEEYKKEIERAPTPSARSFAMQKLLSDMQQVQPEFYKPVEDFLVEKSSKTFGNVAFKAFEKHKEKAPVLAIENLYPGLAFSSTKDQAKLIDESRKEFIKQAIAQGYSERFAEEKAEKLIGANFDVGHANLARKHGISQEDIVKEAEAISKYVKHVHLTDNFGFDDSHLPPGMGNVPIKELMEKLNTSDDVRKIVEAGPFAQNFKRSPFTYNLEGMGSNFFTPGSVSGPSYWDQNAGTTGNYGITYGMMLPAQNYEILGAGWSSLPPELGGAKITGGTRTGRPME
jgi:sugar phosphate isomerase/epimerase